MSPDFDPINQQHCDAVHEAAHAVVGVKLGERVEYIEIRTGEAGLNAGGCQFVVTDEAAYRDAIEHGNLEVIRAEMTILLVGRLAEIKAGYYKPGGGLHDAQRVGFLMRKIRDVAATVHDEQQAEASRHLSDPDTWAGILRVADELARAGRLDGDRVHQLLAGG